MTGFSDAQFAMIHASIGTITINIHRHASNLQHILIQTEEQLIAAADTDEQPEEASTHKSA